MDHQNDSTERVLKVSMAVKLAAVMVMDHQNDSTERVLKEFLIININTVAFWTIKTTRQSEY